MYDRARAAVLEPTSATHAQSTALTIDYLQVQAAAALVKMHDTRTVLPQYLSSQGGVLCAGNYTVQGHADTLGVSCTILPMPSTCAMLERLCYVQLVHVFVRSLLFSHSIHSA